MLLLCGAQSAKWLSVSIDGGRGSSVGRARDSWWGGPGFNPRSARPLSNGWVGVSIMCPAETEVMVPSRSVSCVAARKIVTVRCLS